MLIDSKPTQDPVDWWQTKGPRRWQATGPMADTSGRGDMTDPIRSAAAWWTFQMQVEAQGGVVLEHEWLGTHAPHSVRCSVGHVNGPTPGHIRQGTGICKTCAGHDPKDAERRFRSQVEALGGRVVEPVWLGSRTKHRVICAAGHYCDPQPMTVNRGTGICRRCAGRIWDVFYVVHNPETSVVKFGVTSGDPRPRLGNHRASGFTKVLRVFEDLPGTEAKDLETELKILMRCAGVPPIDGSLEYFPDAARSAILGTVDAWLDPEGVAHAS